MSPAGPGGHDWNTAPEYVGLTAVAHGPLRRHWVSVSGPATINSFFHGLESVACGQNLVRIPIVREKLLNRLAPKGGLLFFFLHYLDVFPPGRQWPVHAI
jgi:hypothetical protein